MSTKNKTLKVSYFELIEKLHPSVTYLSSLSIEDIDTLMSVVEMKEVLDSKVESYQKAKKNILESNCEKDEDGNPIQQETEEGFTSYKYEKVKDKEIVIKKLNELNKKKVEVKCKPIEIESLKDSKGLKPSVILGCMGYINR